MRLRQNLLLSVLLQAAVCGLMVSVGVSSFPALLVTALVAGSGPLLEHL